jgi:hypothetical protein
MSTGCHHPLIIHRVPTASRPGEEGRRVEVRECPDPNCLGRQADHEESIPCRWSWRHAHGPTYNGKSFPMLHCPDCVHIERAGLPAERIEAAG